MTSPATAPSQGDLMLFYSILRNCKSKPDVDWAAVAADRGFKSADVAKTRYGQVRRKYEAGPAGGSVSSPATKATPSKGNKVKKNTGRVGAKAKTPKKSQQMDFQDGDDEDFDFETPSKIKDEEIPIKEEVDNKVQGGFKSLFG
ncbi:hypothetical protein F5X68DRAFT_187215 [Plectosphaerella plurivora]|uniref:Myb-like DNA-binding domain-containing protein n=1 Tax=Plectosphaerella plurivora TaxID=936078 RepID=A0A9P8VLQ9_9PEZI|nr:hypothetical protein F5X68DRAFT_187215 [Plectosphaerella plurivora]